MGKNIFIAFLVIFVAVAAKGQTASRVAKPDSSSYAPTAHKQSKPESSVANDLSFEVKVVPGALKKFNIEMVSPKSGYAEVSLLNSRGDQVLVLYKGKVRTGLNVYKVDSVMMRPGLYYVVTKYDGGLQVADKFTISK